MALPLAIPFKVSIHPVSRSIFHFLICSKFLLMWFWICNSSEKEYLKLVYAYWTDNLYHCKFMSIKFSFVGCMNNSSHILLISEIMCQYNVHSCMVLYNFIRTDKQLLLYASIVYIFLSNCRILNSRMERQHQEDELKSRSTRKGQDSDKKKVCYFVLYVVPSFMFS